ncbi:SDR family NAD-dependent epimerase/dehydratase [Loktanella sp. D2R18]|uniref:NAD-dependent epimerase/dehydratase family protein n=1 Tax=Rhodobacterales TaxID=204455 RepID=UPI000DEA85E8|nr:MULTISPECIES: NAD-dependent epimerase/dehydratase family protein [Rhodobacterales]MDO6590422.1 GDP-mannose 4,6-dehydratase [Yoonia sp. 1_MG-2023]RBW41146.1 SDR family NAD-dependent epimerase/dehydratase [Loktanella sp. D2R18]
MTFWTNKSVLVAGGAGFIGTHLVRALIAQGARVNVVDNFSTGSREGVALLGNHQLTVTDRDIATVGSFPQVDIIFNLASPASPPQYQADPLQTWRSNIYGTAILLDHAQQCGACFVQASTSEVYGDPLSHPQKESDWGNVNPVGPRSCYDESKRAAESLLMDAFRHSETNIRIARIFNTYGPGMAREDGRALPNFIAQAQANRALTIHGDGSQTRSFCYVSDTVDGLMRLASEPGAKGEVINIGNPHEVTIGHIAARVNAYFGNDTPIEFHPRPVDDPTRRCPDISKAQSMLGWAPQVTLDDGLAQMIVAQTDGASRSRSA